MGISKNEIIPFTKQAKLKAKELGEFLTEGAQSVLMIL
jgi:hypothetical protein